MKLINFALLLIVSLLSASLSTYTIYTKHQETEHARAKILKEVGIMILTLVIVIFLGGIASMLANVQVGMRWGEVAGILSARGWGGWRKHKKIIPATTMAGIIF